MQDSSDTHTNSNAECEVSLSVNVNYNEVIFSTHDISFYTSQTSYNTSYPLLITFDFAI